MIGYPFLGPKRMERLHELMAKEDRMKRKEFLRRYPLTAEDVFSKGAFSIQMDNIAKKVWRNRFDSIPRPFVFDVEDYWAKEFRKCIESEEYFYNNYITVGGKKPEPVPEGYFKKFRLMKQRRNGRTHIPWKWNEEEDIRHLIKIAQIKEREILWQKKTNG